jgi:hypothetical protein
VPAFALGYLLLLSASPLQMSKYALPVAVMVGYMASIAVKEFLSAIVRPGWPRAALVCLVVAPIVTLQVLGCLERLQRFQNSDLPDIAAWMQANLPPGSRVVQDLKVDLPSEIPTNKGKGEPIHVVGSVYAADVAGSIEEARQKGFAYAAVCERSYATLWNPRVRPREDAVDRHNRRKAFYEALRRDGQLLWDFTPPPNSLLSRVSIYRLPNPQEPPLPNSAPAAP